MRTITTREQLLVNGKVRKRIATHIVTGAHGYETLCTSGYRGLTLSGTKTHVKGFWS